MIGVAIGLTYFSTSWVVWTVLMVVHAARVGPAASAHDRRARAAGSHPSAAGRSSRS